MPLDDQSLRVLATAIEVLTAFWPQNRFWRSEGHYAARCNSSGMAYLAVPVPDQPDVFCFADTVVFRSNRHWV
jgi:hypothetical protein